MTTDATSDPPGTHRWAALAVLGVAQQGVFGALLAPSALGLLTFPDRTWAREAALLGAAGAALFAGLTVGTTVALTWLALLAVAGALVAVWQRLPTSAPVVAMLREPPIARPLGALPLLAAAGSAVYYLAPFFLERIAHRSPAATGLAVLAFPLGMGTVGLLGGALADRWGARRVTLFGTVVVTAGLVLALPITASWQPATLAWHLALVAIGVGLFVGPNQNALMGAASRTRMGSVRASAGLARSLGFALGPTAATAAWSASGYTLSGMRAGLLVAAIAAFGAAAVVASGRTASGLTTPAASGSAPAPSPAKTALTRPRGR